MKCGALWWAAAVPIIKRKDKQYSNDKEYMGKFLIKDSLTSLLEDGSWNKSIGGYTCYKATAAKKPAVILETWDCEKRMQIKEAVKPAADKKTNF
jgi:hypothetical protein